MVDDDLIVTIINTESTSFRNFLRHPQQPAKQRKKPPSRKAAGAYSIMS